jgi:hypothetical protein
MDRGDLANLTAFVAVADQRSFRAAASQLGVTPSALSHSCKASSAGVRLLSHDPHRFDDRRRFVLPDTASAAPISDAWRT